MRFCCLGSGSRGNAFVVEHGATTVLIDCGFSIRELTRRLNRNYLNTADIDALLISHEHKDHTVAVVPLAKLGIPVYMTTGTARQCSFGKAHAVISGISFTIGGLQILPITVPHDAAEPVQFIVDDGVHRLGVFSDLGYITPVVRDACKNLDAIMIECNYSAPLLAKNEDYPEVIKQRIVGQHGHLDNIMAAEFIAELGVARLQHIVAVHLSENNNTELLVREAFAAVGCTDKLTVAGQKNGTDWLTLTA